MKKLIIIFAVIINLSAFSQITYLKGSHRFCPEQPIEFWAYGDTMTHWAYADAPDSIISTDWHFIDYPESAKNYYLYSSVDTTLIEIFGPDGYCFCSVYIPNRFTPNGDSYNQYFEPVVNCDHLSTRLTIFNREQLVIYDEQGLHLKWDGKHAKAGHDIADDVYPYIFSILTLDGQTITKEGFVFLGR